jgi:HEPN domain-containing protein
MSDEPEPDDLSPASRWFGLAEQDIEAAACCSSRAARRCVVGFLSQQAAEKALKAGVIALGVHPPHIHRPRQLNDAIAGEGELDLSLDDLDLLDPWVIDGRYAADLPDVTALEAAQLLDAAQRVVEEVRLLVRC